MSKNNLLRVTQMDAIHLDREIERIILKLVQDSLTLLPPGFTALYELEIQLLVKLLILYYSIAKHGCTFGQKVLAINYKNISATKRVLYMLPNVLDYLKNRLEGISSFSDLNKTLYKLEMFLKFCCFLNLSVFLKTGRKPLLIERILGLEQIYAHDNLHRQFHSKYMTRELLWNGFIEVLVYVLPLVNYHKIKRVFRNFNPFHKRMVFKQFQNRVFTVQTHCAYCNKFPFLPHHMGCSHIFCYTCLKGNQIADPKYECPVCEYTSEIGICERVSLS